ncbi:MAG: glycosyltransferase [bacterium]
MTIIVYCQYLLGIGHLARTLVIAQELAKRHRVVFICGGRHMPQLDRLPGIEMVWLKPVASEETYTRYYCADDETVDYEEIAAERCKMISKTIDAVRPDIFWIEAFPFARRRFCREIVSSIDRARRRYPHCRICCSVRDILLRVQAEDNYRHQVASELNRYFDLLFVHSDPRRVPFELTFGSLDPFHCPIVYTGYVSRQPRAEMRKQCWEAGGDIVVNVGGSRVGKGVIEAAIRCHQRYYSDRRMRVFLFPEDGTILAELKALAAPCNAVTIHEFTFEYINYLQASSLVICMGGYNSLIEAVATVTPAVVVPYNGNDEQPLRVQRLGGDGTLEVVPLMEIGVEPLRAAIERAVVRRSISTDIDLGGAQFIDNYLGEHCSA